MKTAGTTWLEELIGLAEAGGDGLALAKEVYAEAFAHKEELCQPYAVGDRYRLRPLPAPGDVAGWTSAQYTGALRHDQKCPGLQSQRAPVAARGLQGGGQNGRALSDMLEECEEPISRNVTQNLYERHIQPLFLN